MEGPFKFWLGPLEIQMVGTPDPQQKMSTKSPAVVALVELPSDECPTSIANPIVKIRRSSYFHNGISYTGKMASLYWTDLHLDKLCFSGILK